ncbi:MAG TPA: hypothetical protein DGT23_35255 [Micromonosporaceae bacterium]|nr:hypothetical protein [Micromonosporaceae bacterium]
MAVEFGDGREPWSVGRGGVRRWLHCRVDVSALPAGQGDELSAWLTARDLNGDVPVLVVTRGDDGYWVHVPGGQCDVSLEELPVWLQRPQPQVLGKPAGTPKAGKARK